MVQSKLWKEKERLEICLRRVRHEDGSRAGSSDQDPTHTSSPAHLKKLTFKDKKPTGCVLCKSGPNLRTVPGQLYRVELETTIFLTLYQKLEKYIPRNETAQPRSQFLHSCIWERFIYSHDQSILESLLHERNLGSTAGAERRAGNCRQATFSGSSMPSPSLLQLS